MAFEPENTNQWRNRLASARNANQADRLNQLVSYFSENRTELETDTEYAWFLAWANFMGVAFRDADANAPCPYCGLSQQHTPNCISLRPILNARFLLLGRNWPVWERLR